MATTIGGSGPEQQASTAVGVAVVLTPPVVLEEAGRLTVGTLHDCYQGLTLHRPASEEPGPTKAQQVEQSVAWLTAS